MTRHHGDDDSIRQLVHAQETLDRLLHLGHHDDIPTLFDEVAGLDTAELERVVIAAVNLLASEPALMRYVKRLGWGKRRRWFR